MRRTTGFFLPFNPFQGDIDVLVILNAFLASFYVPDTDWLIRTGTMACCILIALGLSEDDAETIVRKAVARPETSEQDHLCTGMCRGKQAVNLECNKIAIVKLSPTLARW
jgi:hypothetical protein